MAAKKINSSPKEVTNLSLFEKRVKQNIYILLPVQTPCRLWPPSPLQDGLDIPSDVKEYPNAEDVAERFGRSDL